MTQPDIIGSIDGREIRAFTIANGRGLQARIMELGAAVLDFQMPGADGRPLDVALGQDGVEAYMTSRSCFGTICGRYGNRIAFGRFNLDGKTYQLTCNEGRHHEHGGRRGFDKRLWTGRASADGRSVELTYRSVDGEEGFPGNLEVGTRFALTEDDRFVIEIRARTDKPTVCNLVHHTYWNLAGQGAGDVLDHELTLDADFFTPADRELITTGEIRSIAGTPLDFRTAKPIGRDIADIEGVVGYDHNLVLRGLPGEMRRAARLSHPASGRGFELHTSEPGLQVYTAGHFDGSILGKDGRPYPRFGGIALESQRFPDSPNKGHFPSPRLDPGAEYYHRMEFRFFRAPEGARHSTGER